METTATTAPASVTSALASVWPELSADPVRAAHYERSVADLDAMHLQDVLANYARERLPLPEPKALRVAVLSRQAGAVQGRAAAPSTKVWLRPSRRHMLAAAAAAAAASALALAAVAADWAVPPSSAPGIPAVTGVEIGAGAAAAVFIVLGLLVSALALWQVTRRGPARLTELAFAALLVLHGLTLGSAAYGLGQIDDVRPDVDAAAAALDAAGLATAPPLHAGAAPGWLIVIALAGMVAGGYGLLRARRHPLA